MNKYKSTKLNRFFSDVLSHDVTDKIVDIGILSVIWFVSCIDNIYIYIYNTGLIISITLLFESKMYFS